MLHNSLAYEKAYLFAIRIVKLNKHLHSEHHEYVISKQVLRCGTSDFSAKVSIAYKEVLETKYWLSLLKDTGYITHNIYHSIFEDADEIAKILFAILRKTRINC